MLNTQRSDLGRRETKWKYVFFGLRRISNRCSQLKGNAWLRGIALPQSLSALAPVAPCTLWCDRALAGLNDAAKNFVHRCGPELLLEFGLQVQ